MIFSSVFQDIGFQLRRLGRWFSKNILGLTKGIVKPIFPDESPALLLRQTEQILSATKDIQQFWFTDSDKEVQTELTSLDAKANNNPWLKRALAFLFQNGMKFTDTKSEEKNLNNDLFLIKPDEAKAHQFTQPDFPYTTGDYCRHLYDLAIDKDPDLAFAAHSSLLLLAENHHISALRQLGRLCEHFGKPFQAIFLYTKATITPPIYAQDLDEIYHCHLHLTTAYWYGHGTEQNQQLALYHLRQTLNDPSYHWMVLDWAKSDMHFNRFPLMHSLAGLISLDLAQHTDDEQKKLALLKQVEVHAQATLHAKKTDSKEKQEAMDYFHLGLARYYQNEAIEHEEAYEMTLEGSETPISDVNGNPMPYYLPDLELIKKAQVYYQRLQAHENSYQSYATLELEGINATIISLETCVLTQHTPIYSSITSKLPQEETANENTTALNKTKTIDDQITELDVTKAIDNRIKESIHHWLAMNKQANLAGQVVITNNGTTRNMQMTHPSHEMKNPTVTPTGQMTHLIIEVQVANNKIDEIISKNENSSINAFYREQRRQERNDLQKIIDSQYPDRELLIIFQIQNILNKKWLLPFFPSCYKSYIYDLENIFDRYKDQISERSKIYVDTPQYPSTNVQNGFTSAGRHLSQENNGEILNGSSMKEMLNQMKNDLRQEIKEDLDQQMESSKIEHQKQMEKMDIEYNKQMEKLENNLQSQINLLADQLKIEKVKKGDYWTNVDQSCHLKPTGSMLRLDKIMQQIKDGNAQINYTIHPLDSGYTITLLVTHEKAKDSKTIKRLTDNFFTAFKDSLFAKSCKNMRAANHSISFELDNDSALGRFQHLLQNYGEVIMETSNDNNQDKTNRNIPSYNT